MGATSVRYVSDKPELGQSPREGFDCSGFVRFVLTRAGLNIPDYIGLDLVRRPIRHANEFWDHYGVAIHNLLHMSGDLIFFSRNGDFPTHVGIVRDQESYIHAVGKNNTKVTVEAITRAIIDTRNAKAGDRILYKTNPIGFKSPTISVGESTYRYHQRLI